jgi:hypothetical protein
MTMQHHPCGSGAGDEVLDDDRFARLIHDRWRDPERLGQLARTRRRRQLVDDRGTLFLVAADHPARGVLSVTDRPGAMADRRSLLQRLLLALSREGVDGVVATADVIDDLLLLGALDDKVAIGSMNRGGLAGAVFELDDRFTGYSVSGLCAAGLDGGKMLLRVGDDDAGTAQTLAACATAVEELASAKLMAMVETFAASRARGGVGVDRDPERTARAIAIASGLGSSSAYTWLKVPIVKDMARVMSTTTMPMLLLGGDADITAGDTLDTWREALALPTVRGVVAGRSLLYPRDGDVAGAVDTAVALLAEAKA